MVKGHLVATGDGSLAKQIDQTGFAAYEALEAARSDDAE